MITLSLENGKWNAFRSTKLIFCAYISRVEFPIFSATNIVGFVTGNGWSNGLLIQKHDDHD